MATAKKRQPAGAESAAALAKPAKLATETTASVKPTKLVAETKLAAAAAVATTTTTAHALLTRTISPPATTLSAVALASTIMTPDNGPEALALHAEVQGAHAADLASAVLSPPLDIRADDKENVRRGQGAGVCGCGCGSCVILMTYIHRARDIIPTRMSPTHMRVLMQRRYNAKRRLSEDDCSYSDSGLVGIVQRQSDNAPLLVSPSKLGKHVTSPYNKVRVIGPQQLTSSTPVVPAASSGAAVRSCGPAHTMLPANGNAAVHTANATANAAFTIGKLDAVAPTTRRAIAKASSVKKAAAKAPATAPVERTRRLSFTGGRCVKQVAGRQSPTPTITNTATICNTAEKDKESTSTSASASVSDDDQSPAMSPHLKRLVRNDGNDEDRPRDSPLTVLVDDNNSVNDDRRAALAAPAIDHCTVAINRETTFSLNSDDEDDDEAESADTSPSPEDPLLIGNEDSLDQTQWPDVGAVNGLNLGSTTTAGMAPTAVHDGGASFLSPIGIHRPAPVQRPLRSTRVTTSANPLVSPRGQQLCCEESLASPVMTFGAQHRQNHQPFLSRPQDETLSACPSFGSASSFSFDAGHLLGGADQLHSSPITTSFGGLPPQGCQQPVAQYGFQNAGTAAPFFGRYSAQYQQQYQFGPDGQDDDAYDAENEELEGAAAYAHYFVVRDR